MLKRLTAFDRGNVLFVVVLVVYYFSLLNLKFSAANGYPIAILRIRTILNVARLPYKAYFVRLALLTEALRVNSSGKINGSLS